MSQIQSPVAATPASTAAIGALPASVISADAASCRIGTDALQNPLRPTSHSTMAAGKEAMSRRLLSRTHFAPSSVEFQVRDKSPAHERAGAWWSHIDDNGTATACSASASTAAAALLSASQGDPSKAFAMAVAARDACMAMALNDSHADTLSVARAFVENGQWDEVEFIVDQKLLRSNEVATVLGDTMRMQDMHGFAQWLCDSDRAAAQHLLARFALNRDEAGMKALDALVSLEIDLDTDEVLVEIAKTTDRGRTERIDAMKLLLSALHSDAALTLQRQLAQGELEVVDLMIAAGVSLGDFAEQPRSAAAM